MKLLVCETGKREGKLEVWVDVEASAAKALGESLGAVAAQADELPPVHAFRVRRGKTTAISRRQK